MQRALEALQGNVWIRSALVAVIAAAIAALMLPAPTLLKATWYVGYFLPAIAAGAAAGFLFWSRRVWIWVTVVFVLLTLSTLVKGIYVQFPSIG
ncbi:MAG TPA: hypothetical protein VKT73_15460 [Xanthobacteraceae bacterium]|nr:hypothetical protein [Xanthobacteraceae bacterium]